MAKPSPFTITALSKRHAVFRRRFDTPAFQRTIVHLSDHDDRSPAVDVFNALLPRSAFELEVMSMTKEFEQAAQIVMEQHLLLPVSATSPARAIGDLKGEANLAFPNIGSLSKRYHEFSKAHFGRPYTDLVADLKAKLVQRFIAAFDQVLAIPRSQSSRPPLERVMLTALDSWASDEIQAEMVAIANEGHVYAHWVAALLLTSEKPLTDAAVEHLLAAHEGHFPHALSTLAELMLVEGYFVDAFEVALLALDAGAEWADSLIDRVAQFTTGMVVVDNGPVRPLMYALVHEVIAPNFHALAMKHRPQWREPSPEERSRETPAFFTRHAHHD